MVVYVCLQIVQSNDEENLVYRQNKFLDSDRKVRSSTKTERKTLIVIKNIFFYTTEIISYFKVFNYRVKENKLEQGANEREL